MSSQKIVLVTGGAGYIGSHTCKALSKAGYLPVTYDNMITGHEWAVKWGPLEVGDVADESLLQATLRKYRPDAVMHFAAFAYVGESVLNPLKYYSNNVNGILTLLRAACNIGIKKIVFSSSCATYGTPLDMPIFENHRQSPINPYGASKLMAERILTDVCAAHGAHSITLRYFNAAGADPEGEIGEQHDPETHLIPLVLDVAAARRSQITVFGDDYPTKDGTCIRDYIHVADLAQAHLLALQKLERHQPSEGELSHTAETAEVSAHESSAGMNFRAYNLGNGLGVSVREVIEMVEKVTGKKIPISIGARRPGDPPVLIANSVKAMDELGWKPKHSSLEEIIYSAWQWQRNPSFTKIS